MVGSPRSLDGQARSFVLGGAIFLACSEAPETRANDAATTPPDDCRPENSGPPEVIVGVGQNEFSSVSDGQELMLERGPQGGHHLWLAVRMKNLRSSGSTITLTGAQPGGGLSVLPAAYVRTFKPDGGYYCSLFGLRYQVDSAGVDYHLFLGRALDVTIEVRDPLGNIGKGTAHILVSTTVLGE